MDELESLAIRECALSGAEGVLFHELMDEMGRRCGNPISRPLQTLLWRRVRLLACLDFARDAPDREMQLKAEPRLEPGTKGQPLRPLPRGEPIAPGSLPERLDQVQELQRLRLTANAHSRSKQVGWIATDTAQSVRVLEVIARSREKGILQSQIATETGLDAKSVFYYMKPLKTRELIVHTSVTIPPPPGQGSSGPKHIKTNIVYLKQFAPAAGDEAAGHEGVSTLEDSGPIEERALQFLQDSPGGLAAETKCKKHAMLLWQATAGADKLANTKGKRNHMWERVRRALVARGLIQRVILRGDEARVKKEGEDDGDDGPQVQEIVCLKLLDIEAAAAQASRTMGSVVAQVSLLEQMLRVIQRAGPAGILQSDLQKTLGMDQRVAYDQAIQLVQCFGVQPSPETVGRQTQYRLTLVGDGSDDAAWAAHEAHAAPAAAGGERRQAEGARADPGEGSEEKKVLTREWLSRQEGWDKNVPCTEQWLRRGNAILSRLAVASAMTVVEVNRFLNSNEKHDRDKTKKHTKIDHKTSERLITQLESLGLLKRGSYKIAGGGYSKLNPSNLDIFEEFKNIDVIHLPSVRPDGPEVAAALKGKGKGGSCGVNEYLEAVDVEPELATQILKHQEKRRPDEAEREKLVWQTGAFLNGYVSCKVKRWYSFHKFLVERFLGYGPGTSEAALGRKDSADETPPPPPPPPLPLPPVGQGIKDGADATDNDLSGKQAADAAGGRGGGAVSVQEAVEAMPVALFLHVVGCGEHVPGLEELVLQDRTVGECSEDVRSLLFRQHASSNTKMVRHRIRETLEALDTIGLTVTNLAGEPAQGSVPAGGAADAIAPELGSSSTSVGAAAERGEQELGSTTGAGAKEKDATVHKATSFVVQRQVDVVFECKAARPVGETFVFERAEDIDNFWRAIAVRSRSRMQGSLVKHERLDDGDSDDAGEQQALSEARSAGGSNVPLFERFPMLAKRKTWSNLAFGDCTAAQRESVKSLLKRQRMAAMDQDCSEVTLKSLVCSPDGVTVATHVARECQLSREVVARLLCKVDTKSRAPFSEPLLPSVGSRLTQLSGRKGAARQRKDNGAAAEGEEAGAGAGSGGKGERKAWSLDMSKLKRQRKRRTTAEIAADKAAGAESKGRKRPKKDGGAGADKGDAGEDDDGGDDGEAQKEAAADWEESEGDGEGAEAESGAKFAKPRSRRKMWQLEDDMHLLIVYAQAVEMSFSSDADRERPLILKGRVDWKQVAGAVGLKSQQCQRRIKALSADLPRLRVLYRMTSRATVNMMTASRPALRLEAAGMDGDAVCKSMQHVLNNLHLSISTAPIDNLDKSCLPPNLPLTAQEIRQLYKVEPLFPNRQRCHAWPDASPAQACILDLLFLVLSVQQEHYNSELALRLLGRFPEADVERALKLLREKGMIVKRRDGDRSCGLSRALEELMSPSKAYATLQREIRLAERKRKWNLDALVSGGQVARTASLLLDKRLKVETLVPDSLGLSLGSSVGERKSGGERGGGGGGAHILSAMFPDDDSEGDGRILDQRISLPQCQVEFSCIDEDDGLGVSSGREVLEVEEEGQREKTDEASMVEDFHERVRGIVAAEGLECKRINVKFAMLLPLWDEKEGGDETRVRGVEWCRERLERLFEVIARAGGEGVALDGLDLASLGFVSTKEGGNAAVVDAHRSVECGSDSGAVAAGGSGDSGHGSSSRDVAWADAGAHKKSEVEPQKMLEMALITLQNQGRVLRVRGLDHHRYVSSRWSHMWSINRESTRSKRPSSSGAAASAVPKGDAACAAHTSDKADGLGEPAGGKAKGAGTGSKGNAKGARAGKGAAKNSAGKDANNKAGGGKATQTPEDQVESAGVAGSESCDNVLERTKEALVDGQVAGPWLTMQGTSSVIKTSTSSPDGSDPLEHLRAAICETVYKHPGMPEEALAQRFRMLNPRTLGDVVSALEMDGKISARALKVPECSVFSADIPTYAPRSSCVFPSQSPAGGPGDAVDGGESADAGKIKRFLYPKRPASLSFFL